MRRLRLVRSSEVDWQDGEVGLAGYRRAGSGSRYHVAELVEDGRLREVLDALFPNGNAPAWVNEAQAISMAAERLASGELVLLERRPTNEPTLGRGRGDAPAEPFPNAPWIPKPDLLTKTWFEIELVDEIGMPIDGIALRWTIGSVGGKKDERTVTTDGAGRARVELADAAGKLPAYAQVSVEDVDALRETVRPRWDTVRDGEWLEAEPDRQFVPLRAQTKPGAQLLAERRLTLVIQPWVVRARLLGMFFDKNKCFLLPKGLKAARSLTSLYEKTQQSTLLAVGHTDTSGTPDYNDPLSLERADSVSAFLRDDVDAWLSWFEPSKPFEKRWGSSEDAHMIQSLSDFASKPPSEAPVTWFQRTRGLTVDGVAGPVTRRQLVTEYMAHDGTTLPAGTQVTSHGAGESFPIEEAAGGAEEAGSPDADAANRRVELYFFDAALGVQPPPAGSISAAGSREYPEWVKRSRQTHDFELLRDPRLLIRLHDNQSAPIGGVVARATIGSRETYYDADAAGWVDVDLGPTCGERIELAWGATAAGLDLPFRATIFVDCGLTDATEQARVRMHNLGYLYEWPMDIAVATFQADFDVDIDAATGVPLGLVGDTIPPDTIAALESIYREKECDGTVNLTPSS